MIVDPDFLDHWKTRTLVALLDNDEMAPMYVIRLWGHCQTRRQCEFEGLSPNAIKGICRFPGDAEHLEHALSESGFVARDGDIVTVVGWREYNSTLIAAWANGLRGGRPKKPRRNPRVNPAVTPRDTHGIPTGYPPVTHGVTDQIGLDGIRLDEKGLEKKPTSSAEASDVPKKPTTGHGTPIPDSLNTPEFAQAWTDWSDYKQQRKENLLPMSWEKLMGQLERAGVQTATEAISVAIASNWQGIHLDAVKPLETPQKPSKVATLLDLENYSPHD